MLQSFDRNFFSSFFMNCFLNSLYTYLINEHKYFETTVLILSIIYTMYIRSKDSIIVFKRVVKIILLVSKKNVFYNFCF